MKHTSVDLKYQLSFFFVSKHGIVVISLKMDICFNNIKFMSHSCFCAFCGHHILKFKAHHSVLYLKIFWMTFKFHMCGADKLQNQGDLLSTFAWEHSHLLLSWHPIWLVSPSALKRVLVWSPYTYLKCSGRMNSSDQVAVTQAVTSSHDCCLDGRDCEAPLSFRDAEMWTCLRILKIRKNLQDLCARVFLFPSCQPLPLRNTNSFSVSPSNGLLTVWKETTKSIILRDLWFRGEDK